MSGSELSYEPAVPSPFTVRLTFEGTHRTGTWGDGGVKRGGITAVKRANAGRRPPSTAAPSAGGTM
jgi:hypothetical protein